jgi:hypothetical protein
MAEEYDLSEAINQVSEESYKDKNRKRRRKQVIVTSVSAVVILGLFAGGLNKWFAKNDFNSAIPLSENITQWSGFTWSYGGDNTLIKNEFGNWKRSEKGAPFVNDESTCILRLITSGAIVGDLVSDAADSVNYTSIFEGESTNADAPVNQTKKAWIPLDGYVNGSIEVLKTSYTTNEGNPAVSYYRSMFKTEQVFTAVVSCDTQEELDNVAPYDGNGDELVKLGLSIKPS